jgi:catechol 2,3-dioxygenase-like lactoylglutathione lyase family enzyme
MTTHDDLASVRYIVDDVPAAVEFYTTHLGFTVRQSAGTAFADIVRGPLRLLVSGPASSGARATPDDLDAPGRNRIHLVVPDLRAEIDRLTAAGLTVPHDVVSGPGGQQVLITDPAGNLVELFQASGPPDPSPL